MPSLVLYMANRAARHGTTLCGMASYHAVLSQAAVPNSRPRHGPMSPQPCSQARQPTMAVRHVAAREETRSSPSQAVSPRVTNTPSLSHSSAPLHPRMGVEVCSCCAASQLGVLACLFRFWLDVEMRPTGGAGRVLCVRALVH